jgi:hypothetical protein
MRVPQVLRLPEALRARRLPAIPVGRQALAAGALGAGALAVVAIVATGGGSEPAGAQNPGVPTVELERRDLVARESVDGTLGFAGEADVINRLSGTITWLPAEGDVIERGRKLFEVDGDPVLLMYGDVPAYRELAEGVSDGPDVEQLESNLAALGFDPGTVDDEFTSATVGAVADWQDSLGLEETGAVELGRVVFMAGVRRVTSLSLALGSDAGSAAGANASTDAGDVDSGAVDSGAGETMLASYVADTPQSVDPEQPQGGAGAGTDKGDGDPKKKGDGTGAKKAPKSGAGASEQPQAGAPAQATPEADAEGADEPEGSGGTASPATTVMTTSSERRVVSVDLDPADTDLAERGSTARVELPDGKVVKGRVASVGTVAETETTAEGETTDPTIAVTISLPEGSRVTGLDQAPVTVELTDEVRRDVFAVPVEALLGTAGDDYAIVVVDAQGRRQVPVVPGLFADGYVEVEGDDLREGSAVEVPGE